MATLVELRNELGLTQRELAQLLDTNESSIGAWERGRQPNKLRRTQIAQLLTAKLKRPIAVDDIWPKESTHV